MNLLSTGMTGQSAWHLLEPLLLLLALSSQPSDHTAIATIPNKSKRPLHSFVLLFFLLCSSSLNPFSAPVHARESLPHARRCRSICSSCCPLRNSRFRLLSRSRETEHPIDIRHGALLMLLKLFSSSTSLRYRMAASCPSQRNSTCNSMHGQSALARCLFWELFKTIFLLISPHKRVVPVGVHRFLSRSGCLLGRRCQPPAFPPSPSSLTHCSSNALPTFRSGGVYLYQNWEEEPVKSKVCSGF